MVREIDDMLASAQEYCGLIEEMDESSSEWLNNLVELLPRLHAQMSVLASGSVDLGVANDPDLDARFELFSRLHDLLGERDSYWLEFDGVLGGQSMTGSLADDLTDIYCELKHALNLLESSTDSALALKGLKQGYRVHWGQHLVDAERHLYCLQARNELAV